MPDEQRESFIFTGQAACNEDTIISLKDSKDLPRDEKDQYQGQHAGFDKQVSMSKYANESLDS